MADAQGILSELSHRVLKQVVAALLEAEGYIVHFANRPNYPHWDLVAYGPSNTVLGVYIEDLERGPLYDGRVSLEETMEFLEGSFTDVLQVFNQHPVDDDWEPNWESINLLDRPGFQLWNRARLLDLISNHSEIGARFGIQSLAPAASATARPHVVLRPEYSPMGDSIGGSPSAGVRVHDGTMNPCGAGIDVAILVALEEEFGEIEAELGNRWEPRSNAVDGGYDYFWTDEAGGYRCVATFVGKMGPQEAVVGAKRLLRYEPAALVNIGIAAGLHKTVCIGDVVVPDSVHAYDKTGKAEENGSDWTWNPRSDAFRAEHALVEEAKHFRMARQGSYFAWQAAGANEFALLETANSNAINDLLAKLVIRKQPQIRVVPLASGCFVVASRVFAEWIRKQNGDLMATEMEAAGMMLSATKQRAHVQALVIRGISDHVETPKSETDAIEVGALRGLAMRNAWRLLRAYLAEGLLPRRSMDATPTPKPIEMARAERIKALERERDRRLVAGESTITIEDEILAARRRDRDGRPPLAKEVLSGRYDLLECIGAGGFATVWRAHDQAKGRLVAIKVLHGQWMHEQSRVERFMSGARRLQAFRHQSIAGVFEDPVLEGDRCYCVMEWSPGGDLRRAVLAKKIDRRQALAAIARALEGLAYAHERGVIHRDFKPSNILLDQNGLGSLSDFDLAHAIDSTHGTRTGGLGTFVYAAPEQLRDASNVDPRADIYGAGMTVLFAVLGEDPPPFVAVLEPKLLDQLPCGLALRRAVQRAVAYKVGDRTVSCVQLAAAILDEASLPEIEANSRKKEVDNPWDPERLRVLLREAPGRLQQRVRGQDRAIADVVSILRLSAMGLVGAPLRGHRKKPRGVLLFVGPVDVGKTELVKAVCELVFGNEDALARFDMGGYRSDSTLWTLLGAPPDYVGSGTGGTLTGAVRARPQRVVVFDEFEKAHPSFFDTMLQLLDDGVLTDQTLGDQVSFEDCLVIFTSNLGANAIGPDSSYEQIQAKVREAILAYFRDTIGRPELLGRIGYPENVVIFDIIREAVAGEILTVMVGNVLARVEEAFGLKLTIADDALKQLSKYCLAELHHGVRGMSTRLEFTFIRPLAKTLSERTDRLHRDFEVTNWAPQSSGGMVTLAPRKSEDGSAT